MEDRGVERASGRAASPEEARGGSQRTREGLTSGRHDNQDYMENNWGSAQVRPEERSAPGLEWGAPTIQCGGAQRKLEDLTGPVSHGRSLDPSQRAALSLGGVEAVA